MTNEDPHRRMDAARIRAELTVQDLWLRYLALGGTNDAFDIDGYLQGLMPLDTFQQDVLAVTVNEALQDSYDRYSMPLVVPASADDSDESLRTIIQELLDEAIPARTTDRPSGGDPQA